MPRSNHHRIEEQPISITVQSLDGYNNAKELHEMGGGTASTVEKNKWTKSPEKHHAAETYQRGIQEPLGSNNEYQYDSQFQDAESLIKVSNTSSEEKKIGIDREADLLVLNNSGGMSKEEVKKSYSNHDQSSDNVIEPIDTSFTRQFQSNDNPSPYPFSPAGISTSSGMESRTIQSPALRGAHAILKRNRRRRAEFNNRSSVGNQMYTTNSTASPTMSEKPESTRSDISTDTWEENSTDITGSAVSVSSGMTDKSSRRQLILQMAKARMKSNRDSPTKISSPMNDDDDDDDGANTTITEGNATLATHEFDLTGDLD